MAVEARFRKSVSWQKAMDLATMVYDPNLSEGGDVWTNEPVTVSFCFDSK